MLAEDRCQRRSGHYAVTDTPALAERSSRRPGPWGAGRAWWHMWAHGGQASDLRVSGASLKGADGQVSAPGWVLVRGSWSESGSGQSHGLSPGPPAEAS
jgi:hypothetical protein